jgi:hypothetical protein
MDTADAIDNQRACDRLNRIKTWSFWIACACLWITFAVAFYAVIQPAFSVRH